ncbi:MAG TPA: hypothetical protein VHP35_17330, partial [Terriglobia bacterium]|nr:hypothetical protein [Terriglobia bacterium]
QVKPAEEPENKGGSSPPPSSGEARRHMAAPARRWRCVPKSFCHPGLKPKASGNVIKSHEPAPA